MGLFGDGDEANRQCHRLGNLMILPPEINSKCSNLPFARKKKIYMECTHLRMVREVEQHDCWNRETLNERELKILEWAEKNWKIE